MPLNATEHPPDLSGLRITDSARKGRGRFAKVLRVVFVVVGILLLASAGIFAFLSKTPKVEVATAHTSSGENRPVLLNASGYVTPRRRATVAAKVTARVEEMYAEEGMHVKAGQVLAILDSSDAKVRLQSAQADRDATQASIADLKVNLVNAERELHRAEVLQQNGVNSQQALDQARTTADSLRARIALAQQQVQASDAKIRVAQQDLDNCVVRSPYDGIVVSKDAQRGEMVSPISAGGGFTRTGIATVVDMNSNEIEVDVNESYIARVKPGQPVIAVLDAYPDWQIPAKVRTVIPTADRQKATVKVRVAFDKLDPRILPDMGVKVNFLDEQWPPKQNATPQVLIPQDAVKDDGGTKVVFLYRDGKAERRAVRLGNVRGNDQEIVAGVNSGDKVIVKPEGIRDGQRVAVKD
jgi:RND family efflux transporter MFP subunit